MFAYSFKFWKTVDVTVLAESRKEAEKKAAFVANADEDDEIIITSITELGPNATETKEVIE